MRRLTRKSLIGKNYKPTPGWVGGPRIQYKTVDTRTEAGLKEAERLQADGWTISSTGFTTIQFYKA